MESQPRVGTPKKTKSIRFNPDAKILTDRHTPKKLKPKRSSLKNPTATPAPTPQAASCNLGKRQPVMAVSTLEAETKSTPTKMATPSKRKPPTPKMEDYSPPVTRSGGSSPTKA